MVKVCCMSKCFSVRSDQYELFEAPADEEQYKKWEEAIRKTGNFFSKKSYICERHFERNALRKEVVVTNISGEILFHVRKILKLFNNVKTFIK